MCQDENENELEDESIRIDKPCVKQTFWQINQASVLWYIEGSIRLSFISSRTNQRLGHVFVLEHEQAISP